MFVKVYIRGIWIAVMSGLVVLLAALLVVVSHEALNVATELGRRLAHEDACTAERASAHAPHHAAIQASVPVASGETLDQKQLEALVQAIVAVPKR